MLTPSRPIFPFTAIVGQDKLKLALILNAIDPSIGGALLSGSKGTGKSSIVRAFVDVLPEIEVVEDCVFNCNPVDPTNMCDSCRSTFLKGVPLPTVKRKMRMLQIPIGATGDRVIGTMDVEKAIREGLKALQPGLLVDANQNILYIDEVNLLPDHLVDMILDAASSGWNHIERDGVSLSHPSRFILVGTMNPEEGSLRPQILDRFSLNAEAETLSNPQKRILIIRRNEEFQKNSFAFCKKYEGQQQELKRKIEEARNLLPYVTAHQSILESIAKICSSLEVDGYRPDIVTLKTARVLAALDSRTVVQPADILTAVDLTLNHRTRRSGLTPPPSTIEIQSAIKRTPLRNELLHALHGSLWRLHPLKKLKLGTLTSILKLAFLPLSMFLSLYLFLRLFYRRLYPPSELPTTFLYGSVLVTILLTVLMSLLSRKFSKQRVINILDLSKITTQQMLGPNQITADSKKRTSGSIDIAYIGKEKADLENGISVFDQALTSPGTSQLPTEKHKVERPLRGKNYLVGKRAQTITSASRGRYIRYHLPKQRPWEIALGPTIRVAAPHQVTRQSKNLAIVIKSNDIRVKQREYRAPFSITLLVDMSFSMTTSIANIALAIKSLHRSVYRQRDRVALIVFKGAEANTLQEATTNLDLIIRKLRKVKASGFTPMALGMLKAWRGLKLEKQRNKDAIPMLIIISDGIANIPLKQPLTKRRKIPFVAEAQTDTFDVAQRLRRDNIRTIIINTSHNEPELQAGMVQRARANTPTEFLMELAEATNGSYYGLSLDKETEAKTTIVEEKPEDWFYFKVN